MRVRSFKEIATQREVHRQHRNHSEVDVMNLRDSSWESIMKKPHEGKVSTC